MIPALRQQFNANYAPEKYHRLLKVMEERCGAPVKFRVCETPVFLPKPLLDQMCEYGKELIQQLNSIEYRKASSAAIPGQFRVPREPPRPLFVQVDFGLVRDPSGRLQPKLVELQGFPSLYAYQAMLSQLVCDAGGNVPGNRRDRVVLVHDHQPAGLPDRVENGVAVHRGQASQIDDLDVDALGRDERVIHRRHHRVQAHEVGGTGCHLRACHYSKHIPGLYPATADQFLLGGGQHFLRGECPLA